MSTKRAIKFSPITIYPQIPQPTPEDVTHFKDRQKKLLLIHRQFPQEKKVFNFDGCYLLYATFGFALIGSILIAPYNKRWQWVFLTPALMVCFYMFIGIAQLTLKTTIPENGRVFIGDQTPIYSLRSAELVNGDFFLGSGSIQNKTYYVYYTRDSDGGYSVNRVDASLTKIFIDRQSGGELQDIWLNINDTPNDRKWGAHYERFWRYELHVPKGTIVEQYRVE